MMFNFLKSLETEKDNRDNIEKKDCICPVIDSRSALDSYITLSIQMKIQKHCFLVVSAYIRCVEIFQVRYTPLKIVLIWI